MSILEALVLAGVGFVCFKIAVDFQRSRRRAPRWENDVAYWNNLDAKFQAERLRRAASQPPSADDSAWSRAS